MAGLVQVPLLQPPADPHLPSLTRCLHRGTGEVGTRMTQSAPTVHAVAHNPLARFKMLAGEPRTRAGTERGENRTTKGMTSG